MNLRDHDTAVIIAGPGAAPDVALISLRDRHGRVDAETELAGLRRSYDGPLLVEPFSALDLPAIAAHADGIVVGAAWMQDFQLLRAVARTGRPVIVQRAPAATLDEWLSAAEYCVAEGNRDVLLCETGTRTYLPHPTIDLALVREAGRRWPVLVDVSADPALATAALSAGARGLLLGEDAEADQVAAARARAALLAPLLGDEDPTTIAEARAAIDRVDAALATLLERRAELAGVVQRLKPVGGFAGRDMGRERRIVETMAVRAPRLGADRIGRIMTVIIEAGLQASEEHDLSRA
ncbi:MAG: 3-deoxy-D-arabino-heptulosonate 7-phosphate synthase-like protein [Actinoallomurus sp.]|jgi:chorismate mutase|nr:3-deoxy-D-arabino-heptulosonate 7-phosphate synthase-like protein [Actinoallomurus sp.]